MRYCLKAQCPICNQEIKYQYHTEKIPYFSEILISTAQCECGFRSTDTLILKEGAPTLWRVQVQQAEDLTIRVIRSSTATIEIPEFGVKIEPGPACEALITNIEGILLRIRETVDRVLSWAETEEERNRAAEVHRTLEKASCGTLPFTFLLKDPCGNSAIVSDRAEKESLAVETEE